MAVITRQIPGTSNVCDQRAESHTHNACWNRRNENQYNKLLVSTVDQTSISGILSILLVADPCLEIGNNVK